MGFGDLFKANENAQLRKQNEQLQKQINELQEILTPEHRELQSVLHKIECKRTELDEMRATKEAEINEMLDIKQREVNTLQERANSLNQEIVDCTAKLSELKEKIIETDETVLLQSFGL